MNDTAPHAAAIRHLLAADPDWAGLVAKVGACRLEATSDREPYEALVRAVAYQQLNGRAAETILGRFMALFPGSSFPPPEAVLASDTDALRRCGFSAAKVAAIRGIAEAALSGIVPSRADARTLSDDDLIARLVALRGIGRWTVEMLLIFTLGRPDILPVDDFAIREGWRVLKCLAEPPKPKFLAELGRAWSPYRSIASWYLWRAAEMGGRTRASEVTGAP